MDLPQSRYDAAGHNRARHAEVAERYIRIFGGKTPTGPATFVSAVETEPGTTDVTYAAPVLD